ncbi:hypothetical protein MRB53_023124 [Persea americana]|uniref:Uncharacterized protein n=1 Tax=Persea americana TaxID=3435 RepID=A0ACC2L8H8_PERAE|nr:hypothetical protein MRB53_023124 [Persea americana]
MVELAAAHLLGDAIPWYQWLARTMGRPTWSAFTRALCSRFGSPEDDDPEGSLAKLSQTTTVRDYQAKFEWLANRSLVLPEPFLLRCFISGLHEDIRAGVKLLSPHTLLQAYTIAKQQEETTSALVSAISKRQSSRSPFNRSSYPPTPPPPLPNPPSKWTTPNPSTSANIPPGVRRLSIAEQPERHAKNLCFNCDEQYRPGHHCKSSQLLLLEADDSATPIERSEEDNEEEPPVEISLHALCGTTRPETMCLSGHIK